MFSVGQRVVCIRGPINPVPDEDHLYREELEIGRIYTIRDVDWRACHAGAHDVHDGPTIRLEGVFNIVMPTSVGPWEAGYHACRFRPVQKTDISVLRAILKQVGNDDREGRAADSERVA
jgi:hypothetical protein